jgi:hypothetical protein
MSVYYMSTFSNFIIKLTTIFDRIISMTLACIPFRLYWLQWNLCIYPYRSNMMHYRQHTQQVYLQVLSSAMIQSRSSIFWDIAHCQQVVCYWCFGTTCGSKKNDIFLDILLYTLSQNATNKTLNDAATHPKRSRMSGRQKPDVPQGTVIFYFAFMSHLDSYSGQWQLLSGTKGTWNINLICRGIGILILSHNIKHLTPPLYTASWHCSDMQELPHLDNYLATYNTRCWSTEE